MTRTATEAFAPPAQEAFAKISSYLTVYVALNPAQFAQADQPILPDPYSERLGLRADPLKAAERAHYCVSWAPSQDTAPEEIHIKKYMLCKIGFTDIGYMHLMETGTFPKGDGFNAFRNGHYRWHGPLYRRMRGKYQQNFEHLLCMTEDEHTEIR